MYPTFSPLSSYSISTPYFPTLSFFSTSRSVQGAIIFIDELDAIGTKRYGGEQSGDREVSPFCIVHYATTLRCTLLRRTVLRCTILQCALLYCDVLFCLYEKCSHLVRLTWMTVKASLYLQRIPQSILPLFQSSISSPPMCPFACMYLITGPAYHAWATQSDGRFLIQWKNQGDFSIQLVISH